MKEGVAFAHAHNVRVYVTANILAHNSELDGVRKYFEELKEVNPDALIISDPGVFMIAKEVLPEMELHISTQANNTNYGTYLFWKGQGAKRVVSARELSLREIKEIRDHIPDDLEIRKFYSWSDVHFLFWSLPIKQLFYWKRCESGSMYSSMSLEILHYGRNKTRRIYACL